MNFTPEFYTPGPAKATDERLEPITKYMATKLITFTPDQNIGEVIDAMLKCKISGAPVLDENEQVVGMISEKDCLRVLLGNTYHNHLHRSGKVKDYMSAEVTTISAEMSVIDVAHMFLKTCFRRFPVMHNGRLVGQVSRRDILKAARNLRPTTW